MALLAALALALHVVVAPTSATAGCAFGPHSYTGTSLGGRPVVPPDNQTQCCEICKALPGCEAGGLDPKGGLCYPMVNVTGWGVDRRSVVPPLVCRAP
jgi:hypothetical protein